MPEKDKIIETVEYFRSKGWMPGRCGALALLQKISDESNKIYITPSIPKKGFLTNNDIFVLRSLYGDFDVLNPLNKDEESLEISRWSSLFIEIFAQRPGTQAVVQYCSKWPTLATRMSLSAWKATADSYPNLLRLSHWRLLSELGVEDELLVPVINYGSPEAMLGSMREKLNLYPNTCAILIRDYGTLIWGESLQSVKNRAEIFNHICELEVFNHYLNKITSKSLL